MELDNKDLGNTELYKMKHIKALTFLSFHVNFNIYSILHQGLKKKTTIETNEK